MYFKPGMSNPLPSTDKIATTRSDQTQDLTGVSIRHLTWILTDSSFIQESDLAMSSSGKMAADKKNTESKTSYHRQRNNHDAQTHNESTNVFMCSTYMRPFLPRVDPSRIQLTYMFMCNTCMRPFLSRADPSRIQLNSTMQASRPPFKICFPSLLFAAQKDPE